MDDTKTLIKLAENEMKTINEELDLQSEKFSSLQDKILRNKKILYRNEHAIDKLSTSVGIRKYILLLSGILLLFITGLLTIKYIPHPK